MTELVGWLSQFLFMISAAPQAYKVYVQGHAQGLSPFDDLVVDFRRIFSHSI